MHAFVKGKRGVQKDTQHTNLCNGSIIPHALLQSPWGPLSDSSWLHQSSRLMSTIAGGHDTLHVGKAGLGGEVYVVFFGVVLSKIREWCD